MVILILGGEDEVGMCSNLLVVDHAVGGSSWVFILELSPLRLSSILPQIPWFPFHVDDITDRRFTASLKTLTFRSRHVKTVGTTERSMFNGFLQDVAVWAGFHNWCKPALMASSAFLVSPPGG